MSDPIRPKHYLQDGRRIEPIKVINDWDLSFNLGNVVKYIARLGRKDGHPVLEDLQKARQYLDFEIAKEKEKERIKNASSSHNTGSRSTPDA